MLSTSYCPACRSVQPVKEKGAQVRCARCGAHLLHNRSPEYAMRVRGDRTAARAPLDRGA